MRSRTVWMIAPLSLLFFMATSGARTRSVASREALSDPIRSHAAVTGWSLPSVEVSLPAGGTALIAVTAEVYEDLPAAIARIVWFSADEPLGILGPDPGSSTRARSPEPATLGATAGVGTAPPLLKQKMPFVSVTPVRTLALSSGSKQTDRKSTRLNSSH